MTLSYRKVTNLLIFFGCLSMLFLSTTIIGASVSWDLAKRSRKQELVIKALADKHETLQTKYKQLERNCQEDVLKQQLEKFKNDYSQWYMSRGWLVE